MLVNPDFLGNAAFLVDRGNGTLAGHAEGSWFSWKW